MWAVTPRRAIAIQNKLARLVRKHGRPGPARLVAGVDAAFSEDERLCIAGVVLWDRIAHRVVEQHVVVRRLIFPYVPGLLSFREGAAILAVVHKLRRRPDALICDGHGLAHPRRLGIASHIGVLTGIPSVGCAKSRLVGVHREPGPRRGARTALRDQSERIGTVLRTRDDVKPVYVSIGHKLNLPTAERVVMACCEGFRLPEPTRLADQLVAAWKRRL